MDAIQLNKIMWILKYPKVLSDTQTACIYIVISSEWLSVLVKAVISCHLELYWHHTGVNDYVIKLKHINIAAVYYTYCLVPLTTDDNRFLDKAVVQ